MKLLKSVLTDGVRLPFGCWQRNWIIPTSIAICGKAPNEYPFGMYVHMSTLKELGIFGRQLDAFFEGSEEEFFK